MQGRAVVHEPQHQGQADKDSADRKKVESIAPSVFLHDRHENDRCGQNRKEQAGHPGAVGAAAFTGRKPAVRELVHHGRMDALGQPQQNPAGHKDREELARDSAERREQ